MDYQLTKIDKNVKIKTKIFRFIIDNKDEILLRREEKIYELYK